MRCADEVLIHPPLGVKAWRGSVERAAIGAARALGKGTVLLVVAHDRAAYLRRCLEAVLRHHPAPGMVVPVVVSEDRGGATEAAAVAAVLEVPHGAHHCRGCSVYRSRGGVLTGDGGGRAGVRAALRRGGAGDRRRVLWWSSADAPWLRVRSSSLCRTALR